MNAARLVGTQNGDGGVGDDELELLFYFATAGHLGFERGHMGDLGAASGDDLSDVQSGGGVSKKIERIARGAALEGPWKGVGELGDAGVDHT